MNLTPLGDRVIVKAVEQEEISAGGIVLPDTAKERPQRGRVLAVGAGRYEDGSRVPMEVVVGDEVVYSKYGGTEVNLEDQDVLILAEGDILAKVAGASRAATPKRAAKPQGRSVRRSTK